MTIPFNLPNLGSTGVIQNPGVGGAIAQAYQGLPAIIQANQQMQMEQERQRMNDAYLQAQMDQMAFNQQQAVDDVVLKGRTNEAAGNFLRDISMPRTTTVQASAAGILPFEAPVGQPMDQSEAMLNVSPELRPGVAALTEKPAKEFKQAQSDKAVSRALETYVGGDRTPENLVAASRRAGPHAKDFLSSLPKDLLPPDGELKVDDKNNFVWIKPDGSTLPVKGVKARQERALVSIGGPGGEGLDFGDASALRKEYMAQIPDHFKRAQAYSTIQAATGTPAGDLSLVFGFMRLLDPASTVREGEFDRAMATAGLPDRVYIALRKLKNGEILTNDQRLGFKSEAWQIVQSQRANVQAVSDFYASQAKNYGVPVERVVFDPYALLKEPKGQISDDEAAKKAAKLLVVPPKPPKGNP